LGRAAQATAGGERRARDRCGRWVLQAVVKVSSWACSSGRVAAGVWARSHFCRVCWNRSTLPWVWGWLGRPETRRCQTGRQLQAGRPG
jgi:hypothetical protein